MSLESTVNQAIKEAMKAKDQGRLRGLRAIKSAILLAKTEKGGQQELDEATESKILQKLMKQRKDSLAIYQEQKRDDLAQQESEEMVVIESFLPDQLSKEEIEQVVDKIITDTGASSARDMGKVMPKVMQELGGKADGKLISEIVRNKLP